MWNQSYGRRFVDHKVGLFALGLLLIMAVSLDANALTVASDGGITIWLSWDDTGTPGTDIDTVITEANSLSGGSSCGPTNTGRSGVGAANSPPSCPSTGSCTGRLKLTGDLEKFSDYIYEASEGNHYLRRVYVSDAGRAWGSADIKWNVGLGGSFANVGGWSDATESIRINSGYRTCIHDVAHHEFGHYFYSLPDRYFDSSGYYSGRMSAAGTSFQVDVVGRDINTVMSNNFPHLFVDGTNASITVDYNPPGSPAVSGEVLTPGLLDDADATNDGPLRAHHGFTNYFAEGEWSILPDVQTDLVGVHTEGSFPDPGSAPAVDIVFVEDGAGPPPGMILLLDRSGSMSVQTNGIEAVQYVQEAGMFLYHSSEDDDIVGTSLYNASFEELFPYEEYDPTNDLPFASFKSATGLTNIALALETAIDELVAYHTEASVPGSEIYLLSDGKQTVGDSLWDQVDRANGLGIRINTLSFGNADADTMESIASGSSGTNTQISEKDDAAELKMIMARTFSTARGRTPILVFKDPIPDHSRTRDGSSETFTSQFMVPPKSGDLQFYVFSPTANMANALSIQLQSPSGVLTNSPAPNNVAQLGRLNGVKLEDPEEGTWKYRLISTGPNLPSDEIELAVYVGNRELQSDVWFDYDAVGNSVVIRGRLVNLYPLVGMNVRANVFSNGQLVDQLPLFDNGAPGVDTYAGDGVFAGLINLANPDDQRLAQELQFGTDKFRVEVEFEVIRGTSTPAPYAHYETDWTVGDARNDYGVANDATFNAWASSVMNLVDNRNEAPEVELQSSLQEGTTLRRGEQTSFTLVVANARPLSEQLRVSLGQGVVATLFPLAAASNARLESRVGVSVVVSNDAEPGPRNLTVQFGKKILGVSGQLEILQAPPVAIPALGLRGLWLLAGIFFSTGVVWVWHRASLRSSGGNGLA